MSESFESAIKTMRENLTGMYDNGHMTAWADVDTSVDLDRLQDAHDHDMELVRKAEYHRGHHDGQRSMDAEHYAVALRLRHLPLDGGSHENLSSIARAIWHNDFGWTQGACAGLRDELIRLLGGVHDEPVPMDASCGAGCAGCDCGAGEPWRVTYDALGNERHKAVCKLRGISVDELRKKYDYVYACTEFIWAIGRAIGVRSDSTYEEIIKRLIYLIGGDESLPNLSRTSAEPDGGENCRITDENFNWESFIESLVKNTEELSRQGKVRFPPNEDGSLDSLKTVEETAALIEEVRRRAESDKIGENCETDDSDAVESSKCRESCESGCITDELRELIDKYDIPEDENHKWLMTSHDQRLIVTKAYAIADRIDEQFKRICEQQEAVLQKTIEDNVGYDDLYAAAASFAGCDECGEYKQRMYQEFEKRVAVEQERDKLADNRDMWRGKAMQLTDVVDRYVGRCDDLLDLLRDAAKEYVDSNNVWSYASEVSENIRLERKCNELQAKLDAIREALDG